MKDKLLKLGRHSFIYGVGNAFSVAGGFILIPLYTHVLSTGEYGTLELLSRTTDILVLVMFMGVRQAFIRFYFEHDDTEWQKTVVGTTLALVLTSSIIIALIFFPFRGLIAGTLFNNPASGIFFVFVVIFLPLDLLVKIGMTHLQIQMKSIKYVTINFIRFILFIASNYILVYMYKMGIIGVLFTNVWIAAIVGFVFLFFLIKWTHLKISFHIMKKLLKFGLPYLPTAFFGFIIMNSDRYFLKYCSSLEDVGVYALGYKIGMFGVAVLMDPFGKIWSPFLYENYKNSDGPELISKVFTLYTLISVAVGTAISVASPVVIPLISGKSFHDSYKLVPLICLGSIFYGMACLADAGILISKKTIYKPFIFGSACIIGVGSNIILITKYGALGAAMAIAITFLALLIINYVVAKRFYSFKIEYTKMFLIFSSAMIVYFFSSYLFSFGDYLHYMKYYSILSLLIFPVILWFGGFFSSEEKLIVRRLFVKQRA